MTVHYYEHNIGDYRRDTGHLTLLEHGIYRCLLDTYYLTEEPLCADLAKLMRSHCVRTADESKALENVLSDFFTLTEKGYEHKRCEAGIAEYREKSAKSRAAADARWSKKLKGDAPNMPTQCERIPDAMPTNNQEPITINQEPVKSLEQKKAKEPTATASRLPADWVPSSDDIDFCRRERPDLLPEATASRFRDYWIAAPGAKARKLDWSATWRNWVRNEKSIAQPRASPNEKFDPIAYVNRNAPRPPP